MGWTHQWFSSVFEVKDLVGAKEVPHAHHTMTQSQDSKIKDPLRRSRLQILPRPQ